MDKNSDTFDRSCDHWSESGREEMEGFYALASLDYQHLAEAIDWKNWLEIEQKKVGSRCLQLLDVACGSGKFPVALKSYAGVTSASIRPIDYALLDPSSFSISEARQALVSPFRAGAEYEMKLQELECLTGSFDIVWAIHALYAIPHNELEIALNRILHAIGSCGEGKNGGAAFIAHASSKSHYLEFYRHYLSGFKEGEGVQYSCSEQIIEMLEKIGVVLEIKEINYTNMAPKSKEGMVEKYLQRCLFDDTINLKDMLSNPVTGPYLEKCRKNGMWEFAQTVSMIFVTDPAGSAIQ